MVMVRYCCQLFFQFCNLSWKIFQHAVSQSNLFKQFLVFGLQSIVFSSQCLQCFVASVNIVLVFIASKDARLEIHRRALHTHHTYLVYTLLRQLSFGRRRCSPRYVKSYRPQLITSMAYERRKMYISL